MWMCHKLGLRLIHIPLGVKYVSCSLQGISLKGYKKWWETHHRSNHVYQCSISSFHYSILLWVPGALDYDIIPCSLRKESNWVDIYSPPQSDQRAWYVYNCFSNSTINSMNLSKASNFLYIRYIYPNLYVNISSYPYYFLPYSLS